VLLRVVVFVLGAWLAAWTVLSAVQTVILPRAVQGLLGRVVFRSLRRLFKLLTGPSRSFDWRDRVMAHFAPVALLVLVGAWLTLITVGFMAMEWAVEQEGWGRAFHVSGSSLLTLGFAGVESTGLRFMAFVEAGIGLALVAMLITYLPAIYAAFSRRETQVALLEVRAGTPPSAVTMLTRFQGIGQLDRLAVLWRDWEVWFADVEESHTTFPALTFFRSPQPDRHWVTAAGTVLDAASLMQSSIDVPQVPEGSLAIRAGFISLRRIADFFGIDYDADPSQGDPIGVTRGEFEHALDELEAAGLPIVEDRDQAWLDFAGWRVNYDTVLLSLAEITMAPYAPWVSDRSTPGMRRPRMRRWGRRRKAASALEE
jgi:hypothetical protein